MRLAKIGKSRQVTAVTATMWGICAMIAIFGMGVSRLSAEPPPNILWISMEDISAHFGCYGDPHAITPNVDALAAEGVRYTHAFTAAGVCAPCRSTVITGMYQTTIGTHHMRCQATLPEFIKPFPVYLREAGYYCTNNSKTDYQFKAPEDTWDESSRKAHWRNREDKEQPFFAVFNFTGCHESGIASEEKYRKVTEDLTSDQRQDPDKLTTLPPYYPDTPVVREDWKRNYELITAADQFAGKLLAELEEDGLADNTIVFFWSDHGVGLPRAKRWLYDSGTRIPLVVKTPERFRADGQGAPGTSDGQLVSSLDFGPTVLNLAGLEIPDHVQGRAFLGKGLSEPRRYVYGARDRMDERYDIIRSVRDHRYRYIRNYEPLKPYYQYMNTPEKGATMREIRRVNAAGELSEEAALFAADRKPVEELYDLENDPHEVSNLIGDPSLRGTLERMRVAHQDWVRETRDLGLIPEPEIAERVTVMGSEYAVMRQAGSEALNARLAEVAALASRGETGFSELRQAIDDEDAAVRFWAATGIGNIGKNAEGLGDELEQRLSSEMAPVARVAVARALCLIGEPEEGLKMLADELEGDQQWTRLHAAIALDEIDEQARPVIDALRKGLKDQPNKYIVRVCNKAVNDLEGTDNRVP
jgi:arylsulfatase A-like enzyme